MVNDRALQSSDRELRKNAGPALGKPLAPPGTLSHLCLCRGEAERGSGMEGTRRARMGASDVPTARQPRVGGPSRAGCSRPPGRGTGGTEGRGSRAWLQVPPRPFSSQPELHCSVPLSPPWLLPSRFHCCIISIDQNSMCTACCSLRGSLARTRWTLTGPVRRRPR